MVEGRLEVPSITFYKAYPPEMKADVCYFFFYLTAVVCLLWPSVSGHFKLKIPGENNQKTHLMA